MKKWEKKQNKTEKKLERKAVKVIIHMPCDKKIASVDNLLKSFTKTFYSVTKVPIYTWWCDGGSIYPNDEFATELTKVLNTYSRQESWADINIKKGNRNIRHQYYYKKYQSDGRDIFSYAIEVSNHHCKGDRGYMMRKLAENFFAMTHPYVNVWLGETKMNPLKLPDMHYYYGKLLHSYYGAIYLRPRNYRKISYEKLIDIYQKWKSYFDNNAAFSLTMDADCLVVLLRYTSADRSETDYSPTSAIDIFNKITNDSDEGEEPLYDAYSFYNKNDFSLNDLRDLRLTISAYELEHDFHYYKALKTNHFFSEVTTYTPPFKWSSYQNNVEPIECSLPSELISRYRNRIETAKKKKKAKELQSTNIKVLF